MSKKREYIIKTQFVFEGKFCVMAESRDEACDLIGQHCGLVLGGDIHSALPEDEVDWDFPVHPKKILR